MIKHSTALTLLGNLKAFLVAEFGESAGDVISLDFKSPMFGKGSKKAKGKKPNCTPGKSWSCGHSCLPMSKKNCGSALEGEPKTLADYLANQAKANSGGKSKTENPKPKESKNKKQQSKQKVSLPEGVNVKEEGDGLFYTFDVGGKTVELMMSKTGGKDSVEVDFNVGGSVEVGGLEGKDAIRAVLKLNSVFEYDMSTRPEGFRYQAAAYEGDGHGDKRVSAYTRIGFSSPVGGEAGGHQFGIIKQGKLVPDTKRAEKDGWHEIDYENGQLVPYDD